MTCLDCGSAMKVTHENRRYDEGGLPMIVLHQVEVRRCPKCGAEEIVIPRIEQLHRVIAAALIHKPSRITAEEIRFLRKYLGWSTEDFARHMGTARETVSRWESGATPMGAQADRLLRMLVARGAPVDDYSSEELTQIGEERRPLKIGVAVKRGGWMVPA